MFSIINITIFILILLFIFLLLKYKKLETIAILAALKVEGISMISGTKKLECAVDWIYNQQLFRDTFLSLIPRNVTKWYINVVFNHKKALIEKENNSSKI